MSVEHELKFVLRLDDNLLEEANKLADSCEIKQGYLAKENGFSIRLRKKTTNDKTDYYFQCKHKVPKTKQVIEISTEILKSDFTSLWSSTKNRLRKTRFYLGGEYNHQYQLLEELVLDFFKDRNGKIYFIMAEIEFPFEAEAPLTSMPDFIVSNLVFKVPLGDSRFSSRKLGNIKFATELYQSLV